MPERPRRLIAGNWKMNGLRRDGVARARALAARATADPPACEVAVFPPATLLAAVAEALAGTPVALGAQDCHAAADGAHTGDISAEMIADAGGRYVIVGHSERRAGHGEREADVRAKAEATHRAGLVAVVCVGETAAERDVGDTLAVVGRRLAGSLPAAATAADTVVAYEPVWAIGTGRTATTTQIAEVHGALRALLRERTGGTGAPPRLLYGGSVNAGNAAGILALDDVDGALVGGASLDVDAFWTICHCCP